MGDPNIIRQKPHLSELHLSIFRPTVVWTGVVNDAGIAVGARSITYTTTSGSRLDVEANFTLWVGTVAGKANKGRVRVKSMNATTITVAENSHIRWANGQYLTIVKYVDVWSIFPRIIQNPGDATKVIFYKDWDVTYTNQNTIQGAFPCAGSHRAALLDPVTNKATLAYTASGTYHVQGAGVSYKWTFEGGIPSTYTGETPGNVDYPLPGDYVTKLEVSGTNGSVDTTYRYVSIKVKPGDAVPSGYTGTFSPFPIQHWDCTELSGSRGEGSYRAKMRVHDNLGYDLVGGETVILWSDDFYGPVGGPQNIHSPNRKEFFVGYILDQSVNYDYKNSTWEFEVGSVTEMMKSSEQFSISCENKNNPNTWYYIKNLNMTRALHHFLRWHSTVLQVADFQFIGNDYRFQYFDTEKGSLFDSIKNIVNMTLRCDFYANPTGKLFVESRPEAYEFPTGTFPVNWTLEDIDVMNDVNYRERQYNSLAYLEMGGIKFQTDPSRTFGALLASAPWDGPDYYGKADNQQGLALESQTHLNWLIGNVYAQANAPIMDLTTPMAGNYRIDTGPMVVTDVSISAEKVRSGKAVRGLFYPERIAWTIDPQHRFMSSTITWNQIVNGVPGKTQEVPPTPEDNPPPPPPPPVYIPPIPIPSFSAPTGTLIPKLVILDINDGGVWYSPNISSDDINWYSMNANTEQADRADMLCMAVNQTTGRVFVVTNYTLWSSFVGYQLEQIHDYDWFLARFPQDPIFGGYGAYRDVAANPNDDNFIGTVSYSWATSINRAYTLYGNEETWEQQGTFTPGVNSGNFTFSAGKWLGTFDKARLNSNAKIVIRLNSDESLTVEVSSEYAGVLGNYHVQAGQNPLAYTWSSLTDNYLVKIEDNGIITLTTNTAVKIPTSMRQAVACDETGQFLLIHGTIASIDPNPQLYKSNDYGATWGIISTFPTGVPRTACIINAGDSNKWIIASHMDVGDAADSGIFYTEDNGDSWTDITGDLKDYLGDNFELRMISLYGSTNEL